MLHFWVAAPPCYIITQRISSLLILFFSGLRQLAGARCCLGFKVNCDMDCDVEPIAKFMWYGHWSLLFKAPPRTFVWSGANCEPGIWRDTKPHRSGCVTRFKNIKVHVSEPFSWSEPRFSIISRHVMSCAVVSTRSEKEYMLFMQWKKS